MRKTGVVACAVILLLLLAVTVLAGCGKSDSDGEKDNGAPASGTGTLVFTANGEGFARESFTSKDGWNIDFERVYVTLSDVTAYQTEPPYDVEDGWEIDAVEEVGLDGLHTVELSAPDADPATVGEAADSPAGHYNAISWNMVHADAGEPAGYSLFFTGKAEKDGRVINFTLKIDDQLAYQGGDYVGDERKGVLEAGGTADVEMTFHLDHFFGDGDSDPADELNVDALGFDPIAALAVNDVVDVDSATLKASLSAEDLAKYEAIMQHLGHVGEGHALAKPLQ